MRYPYGRTVALTPKDFDFEKQSTPPLTTSYQRLNGRDVITHTENQEKQSCHQMPEFYERNAEYIGMLYEVNENDRPFPITKHYLHHEMDRVRSLPE